MNSAILPYDYNNNVDVKALNKYVTSCGRNGV